MLFIRRTWILVSSSATLDTLRASTVHGKHHTEKYYHTWKYPCKFSGCKKPHLILSHIFLSGQASGSNEDQSTLRIYTGSTPKFVKTSHQKKKKKKISTGDRVSSRTKDAVRAMHIFLVQWRFLTYVMPKENTTIHVNCECGQIAIEQRISLLLFVSISLVSCPVFVRWTEPVYMCALRIRKGISNKTVEKKWIHKGGLLCDLLYRCR